MASSISAVVSAAACVLAAAPLFAQSAQDHSPSLSPVSPAAIRALLDGRGSPQPLCATSEGRAIWTAVQAFYAERGDEPAWFEGSALTPAGQRLVAALRASTDEGLDPLRYEPVMLAGGAPRVLRASVAGDSLEVQASALEVGLTAALGRFAADLGQGRVDPSRVTVLWRLRPRGFDVLPVLLQAAASGRPDAVLDSIRPAHPQYAALREALRHYAALAASESDLPPMPAVRVRLGAKGPAVRALRARLAFWGDLDGTARAGDVFDRVTADAVRRFQTRHGLTADGVVSPETLAALNVPARDRLRQIVLNLERWRWQDRPVTGRHVLVNIPTFELHAYDGGALALSMRVITGKADTPTPVFDQPMTSVVFSPYWNVPTNIALDETLPAVRRDRGHLRRANLEVLRGDEVVDPARIDWKRASDISFRQRPGPGNSLGLVKFNIANPFNVYLHDTPNDSLFRSARRTMSHGCVRLEKPEALARWVLAGMPGWTPARIAAAMRAGRESAVRLADPIPVSIGYFTAWVDPDGAVQFRPDVYRHDAAQAPLMDLPEAPIPAGTTVAAAG
jgi:murein L,D-transpeptidase YcbB/YkuD